MHLSLKFTTVVYLFGTVHPHDDDDDDDGRREDESRFSTAGRDLDGGTDDVHQAQTSGRLAEDRFTAPTSLLVCNGVAFGCLLHRWVTWDTAWEGEGGLECVLMDLKAVLCARF